MINDILWQKNEYFGGTYVSIDRIPAHPRDADPDDGV